VLYDRATQRATGVRVIDALTSQTTEYTAKVVFLCASTLNSTWLLMQSATDVWPEGLGSSSGQLGHNLMDHHFRVGAEGFLVDEVLNGQYYFGNRPTGFYIPRYRNVLGDKREYLRGLAARRARGRHRRRLQGPRGRARRLADRRDGVRRDPASPREQGHAG
jgi:choline dehydrogenase-like flavoprotein